MSAAVAIRPAHPVSARGHANLTLGRAGEARRKLEGWLFSEGALELPLDAVERETEERGREVLRLMLQAHVQARGTGDVGRAIEVAEAPSGSEAAAGARILGHRRVHGREWTARASPWSSPRRRSGWSDAAKVSLRGSGRE